jgi:hypothetical protein
MTIWQRKTCITLNSRLLSRVAKVFPCSFFISTRISVTATLTDLGAKDVYSFSNSARADELQEDFRVANQHPARGSLEDVARSTLLKIIDTAKVNAETAIQIQEFASGLTRAIVG